MPHQSVCRKVSLPSKRETNRLSKTANASTPPKGTTKKSITVSPPPGSPLDNEYDVMSIDTEAAGNINTQIVSTAYGTFLTFRFNVEASVKATDTMQAKISKLYEILLQADDFISFSHYKLDIDHNPVTKEIITATSAMLDGPDDIPTSITSMGTFFFGAKPNSKGVSV